ncbi:Kinesin, motor domain-containing protein [Cynara cardunculus var. scolymus]|uniref:Kinesin-like protein n=1 Tax=Cynara cardunculus var. scolymus TaxID=59895 RepID=A0A118K6Z9_CYNCS|nr:Kinesin, motor domain-containing protein [Cynara cardunculus var. scolymus]
MHKRPVHKMSVSAPVTPATKIPRTSSSSTPGGPRIHQDKILVTVRIRPLTPRELAAYDLIAWDCTDENTVVSRNLNHDRHNGTYTFGTSSFINLIFYCNLFLTLFLYVSDKVFDPSCPTTRIYEQGARDVALSAINGINESKFALRLSALEIYNETVVDLLNRDSGALRLLDDPEKGTVVEKLTEEVVKDGQHLRFLIATCEAQRQVGETSLNDRSSRSHQIIRLTIESSSLCEESRCGRSLLASLSLVDLAGSERVAQTNADGTRLKEGSHINRSLLTLTTVIRKLSNHNNIHLNTVSDKRRVFLLCSGGKKTGHIPYRDSKLTRILQSSLGGNARTAIICTLSPALSHVEQSRNTLCFATSAKEVTNSAQVNMVVADKQLVKHLQKEVTRLKAELLSPEPSSSKCLRSLLLEKEQKIQQMEREMNELKRERDLAQSELEVARKLHKETKELNHGRQVAKCLSFNSENVSVSGRLISERKTHRRRRPLRQSAASINPCMLVHEIRKLEMRQRQLGEEANRALELLHKEVSSHRLGNRDAAGTIAKLLSDIKDMHAISSFIPEDIEVKDKASLKEEIVRLKCEENTIASLEEKLENVQKSLDKLVMYSGEETPDSRTPLKKKKILPFTLRNNGSMPNFIRSPCSPSSSTLLHGTENRDPVSHDLLSAVDTFQMQKATTEEKITPVSKQPSSVNVKKIQMMFKTAAEDNIRSIKAYVTELKERVAKLQYQKQLLVCQVLELEEANDGVSDETDMGERSPPMAWHLVFEDQRKQIIMLWHLCHVSIVHRTQFFMLFRGDPADEIYIEVELKRLTWLEQQLSEVGNASPALLGDEPAGPVMSSIKALKQEREYLAKRVSTKLSAEEREMLYRKWDIPMEGKQRRRLQLVSRLWTDPLNMVHVKESAEIVAKLVGFCELGEHASKEMFALNFVTPCDKKAWMGWNLISNLLHL